MSQSKRRETHEKEIVYLEMRVVKVNRSKWCGATHHRFRQRGKIGYKGSKS